MCWKALERYEDMLAAKAKQLYERERENQTTIYSTLITTTTTQLRKADDTALRKKRQIDDDLKVNLLQLCFKFIFLI